MLSDEEILAIISNEVNERYPEDEAFSDISINSDYNVEFTPSECSDSIDLYNEVTMVISEWLGFGEQGFAHSFTLPNLSCIRDTETFTIAINKVFDKYSKDYHDTTITHRMDVINHITDDDKKKIKSYIDNNKTFTIEFTGKTPYYKLV